MDSPRQQVHIGPISLFTLVASLGMAVLAVLALSTSNAMYALANRAADMTSELYVAETCAQRFVADLDTALSQAASGADARTAVSGQLGTLASAAEREAANGASGIKTTVSASMEGDEVTAVVTTPIGRRIDVRIEVAADGTYQIVQWKTTTETDSSGAGETLWSPTG
ncbi:MAG: hypothetical protein IJ781_07015 [Atopobiaceae bacterium]|nr:hypothetical protein [Atopobiaceae bacterium]